MVWAAVNRHGKSSLVFLEGKQNSRKYCDTLQEHLMPFIEHVKGLNCGKDVVLQQDNASIHVSKFTGKFIDELVCCYLNGQARAPISISLRTFGVIWCDLFTQLDANLTMCLT